MRIIFGLASGIGNIAFCLPAIKALRGLGHEVIAYVDGDVDMAPLLRRCRYLAAVVDAKREPPPHADHYAAGHWCPPALKRVPGLRWHRYVDEPNYPEPEWSMALRAARDLGWQGERPDVSDWCADVARGTRWDVGIVPGCKPGIWERKRYPGLAVVARYLTESHGLSCAVFGQAGEARGEFPTCDDQTGRYALVDLPDALASCRVVIGTDSGPLHLASSLGVPVVGVYTATSTIKGEPVGRPATLITNPMPCRPCQATTRWQACQQWRCRDIAPGRVVAAAMDLLGQTTQEARVWA